MSNQTKISETVNASVTEREYHHMRVARMGAHTAQRTGSVQGAETIQCIPNGRPTRPNRLKISTTANAHITERDAHPNAVGTTQAHVAVRTGMVQEAGCTTLRPNVQCNAIFQTGAAAVGILTTSTRSGDLDTAQLLKLNRICTTTVANGLKKSTGRVLGMPTRWADGEHEALLRILIDLQRGYNCTLDLTKNADRIANNLVLNLSQESLTPGMETLLRRGVQFAPISPADDMNIRRLHNESICDFLYVFADKLEWANKISNEQVRSTRSNAHTARTGRTSSTLYCDLKRRFGTRAEVVARDLSFAQLELLSRTSDILRKSNLCYTRVMNLSSAEWVAMRKLRNLIRNNKIVIRKADKCRQIVICDYEQYRVAVLRLLNDPNNYERIPYNGNMRSAALLIQVVRKYEAYLGKNLSALLLSNTRQPKARAFYGLPKTHKSRDKWTDSFPPLRPICPDVGTETAASGRYIAKFLQPYFERIPSYLRNSLQLVAMLNEISELPATATFMVADVDSLYPNIPVQDAFDSVARLLRTDSQADAQQVELVLDMLKVHLENNCFTFDNTFYKQTRGIPMGRAWAPAVASIFMSEWDHKFLDLLSNKPIVYRRYIDDIFCLFGDRQHAVIANSLIDNINANIRAGDRSIATDVHFLDLRLRIIPNTMRSLSPSQLTTTSDDHIVAYTVDGPTRVHISLYRKDTDLMCLLHHGSAHTRSLKLNVLFSQLVRIFRLSNDNMPAGWHMRQLIDVQIRVRCLSLRDARTVWSRLLNWVARNVFMTRIADMSTINTPADRVNAGRRRNRTLLRIPFIEKKSGLRNDLATIFEMLNDVERECTGELAVVNKPPVSLQRLFF
jgi:hypothetical protein